MGQKMIRIKLYKNKSVRDGIVWSVASVIGDGYIMPTSSIERLFGRGERGVVIRNINLYFYGRGDYKIIG